MVSCSGNRIKILIAVGILRVVAWYQKIMWDIRGKAWAVYVNRLLRVTVVEGRIILKLTWRRQAVKMLNALSWLRILCSCGSLWWCWRSWFFVSITRNSLISWITVRFVVLTVITMKNSLLESDRSYRIFRWTCCHCLQRVGDNFIETKREWKFPAKPTKLHVPRTKTFVSINGSCEHVLLKYFSLCCVWNMYILSQSLLLQAHKV